MEPIPGGAAKPDPAIFRHALAAHTITPADAVYVGDSVVEDILPARAAGMAAGYLIVDPAEEAGLKAATAPGTITNPANLADPANDLTHVIPLVIQDKTFVPDTAAGGQLAAQDPTWDTVNWGGPGDLWFPHVYVPNQNPYDMSGANAMGRWDYGPWFWPPQNPATLVSLPSPCTSSAYTAANPPAFPPLLCPGTPNPSGVPEGFMDTPVINGTAYPSLTLDPAAYRFQILSAGNDRTWNMGFYVADPLSVAVTSGGAGYTTPPTVAFVGGGGTGVARIFPLAEPPQLLRSRLSCDGGGATTAGRRPPVGTFTQPRRRGVFVPAARRMSPPAAASHTMRGRGLLSACAMATP